MAFIGRRGQISIEFMLIVTIALLYINLSVWPTIEAGSQSAKDIKAVADTKIAASKFAGALNEAFVSSGDMKKTIGLYIPQNSRITCIEGESSIGHETRVLRLKGIKGGGFNPDLEHCQEIFEGEPPVLIAWNCSSSASLLGDLPQGCSSAEIGGPMEGPVYREMIVEKDNGTVSFRWK